ncbi:MAG: cell division septation protein DedD [Halioglobus sp.]|jgi:cell division septation protein DedD
MSKDDIEDDSLPEEDAFYEADYDEDTIDYELDAGDLLEEESYPINSSGQWETITRDEAPLPNLDPGFELDGEGEFVAAPVAGIEAPWSDESAEMRADPDSQQYSEPWPLGLIAVAIFALVLLTAGGYGVVQQRAAMKEEIRQLQAEQSTTASKQDIADNRQAQRAVDARNDDLQFQIDALQRENQNLHSEIAGLEIRLSSTERASPAPPATAPKKVVATAAITQAKPAISKAITAAPIEKTAASKPLVIASDKRWFVNFGSYSNEATAKKWAAELNVDEGELIVVPGQKGSKNYYRVRVVDLPNRTIAEEIADQLERTYSLPKLWVGQQ